MPRHQARNANGAVVDRPGAVSAASSAATTVTLATHAGQRCHHTRSYVPSARRPALATPAPPRGADARDEGRRDERQHEPADRERASSSAGVDAA